MNEIKEITKTKNRYDHNKKKGKSDQLRPSIKYSKKIKKKKLPKKEIKNN